MEFANIEAFILLIFVPFMLYFWVKNKNLLESIFSKESLKAIRVGTAIGSKVRNLLLIIAFIFGVIALARPQIDKGSIKVKQSFSNIVVGFDISQSMFANDLYPNRFEFAKRKFYKFLDSLKRSKVALIGFSSRSFLIAPLTQDYNSLKFLTKNLGLKYLNLRGTSIMSALKAANELFENSDKKILLLFSDGGDSKDFSKEIEYAKKHNIVVFVYGVGTNKGGVIKGENGVLKDKNGNIVVVKRNDAIKNLALESGGAYMIYSLNDKDMKELSKLIESKNIAKESGESEIKVKKELFYYPLILAILLLFAGLFSIRGVKVKRG